jgi:hypothetical protein
MDNSFEFHKNLPKVDLHRHLEGSLRLMTMMEVARASGIIVPTTTGPVSSLVQVQSSEPYTSQNSQPAAQASFLPETEREALMEQLRKELGS